MITKDLLSEQFAAGWLLILGGIIFVPGGLLYTGRAIFKWPAAQSQGYLFLAVVCLAFVGQALFGASILRSGLLPGWVGWTTIVWNLAWLVILPIARPQDVYYPWLHYVAPLIIGIALLGKG